MKNHPSNTVQSPDISPNVTTLALLVSVNPAIDMQYPITKSVSLIGRGIENDIQIHHDTISNRHAELRHYRDGYFIIKDLASTNGLMVNGRKIQSCIVHDGDRIDIGEMGLHLQLTAR